MSKKSKKPNTVKTVNLDYTVKNNGTLVGVFPGNLSAQEAIYKGLDAGRSVKGYTVEIYPKGDENPVNPVVLSAEDFLNNG